MSFTNYYFELGVQTTLEKHAAKKKKEEGMGWGAKLGLGALGAGALGAGAYYSPEILSALGADNAAQWAGENIQTPMQEAGIAAGKYLGEKGTEAGKYLGEKGTEAKDYLMDRVDDYKADQVMEDMLNKSNDMGKLQGYANQASSIEHAKHVLDLQKELQQLDASGSITGEISGGIGNLYDTAAKGVKDTFAEHAINPIGKLYNSAAGSIQNAADYVKSNAADATQLVNGTQPGSLHSMGVQAAKDIFGK